jgi:hypothetical protein
VDQGRIAWLLESRIGNNIKKRIGEDNERRDEEIDSLIIGSEGFQKREKIDHKIIY